ncbi:nudix hydrolase 19, chloroplastic-like [Neltuma alba]|uniref:nudix hydrolase 19, chloroplastic-like n=1 Tax=Neltuma alba TaxID=207710 RepID=UPI0010A391FA|nr:nudix hydrolase 19, chloroplastic-like [Prosopis alba]
MIKLLPLPSSSTISSIIPTSLHTTTLSRAFSSHKASLGIMSINSHPPAYSDNTPLSRSSKRSDLFSPTAALESLKFQLSVSTQSSSTPRFKVLPFRNGRPLASSSAAHSVDSQQIWHVGWVNLGDLKVLLETSGGQLSGDSLVYAGSCLEDDVVYWAIDVSSEQGLLAELGSKNFCFVELRSLMVASDWSDLQAMGNLAIAGHARALLEWHNISQFCGHCGEKTVTIEAGRRKQCSNESCRKRIYPRVDPVVIMLVIDRENDCILLGRKSSFVPRMWSCLAGFIEPGESLEEAVRRETWEETGIEVGEVVYHSSQPWPVGPSSMPCQLMVGFFAYAKSLDINVDKKELEDAQWYSREAVRKALTAAEYKKAQGTAASKVEQMCKGVEKSQSLTAGFNVESGELASMFVPGPHAIAHRLISSWAFQNVPFGIPCG